MQSDRWVLFGHHLLEFFKWYSVVFVLICVLYHLLDLGSRKPFPHTLADLLELIRTKRTYSFLVKYLEKLLKAIFALIVAIKSKYLKKSLEIHLDRFRLSLHNLQNLSSLLLQSQSSDSRWQLLSRYFPTFVIIKYVKTFFESHHIISW